MPGYLDFLELIQQPSSEEGRSTLEWAGGCFDPEDLIASGQRGCAANLQQPVGLSQQRPQLLQQKQSDRLFTMSSLTSGIDTAVGQPGQSEQDRSKQTRARTS